MSLVLAYADPPYLGQCARYGHRHEAPYGCWDEVETHAQLINNLDINFDGWACSLTSSSLGRIMHALDGFGPANISRVRVAAWVKPFATYRANVRIAYTWEPLIFAPGRDSSKDGAPVGRDHLAEPIALTRGLVGAKPSAFCRWVLDLLGYLDGDELEDVFPGTGVMGRVAAQGRLL